MNRTIRLGNLPERIVSLVPSQTELLYDLGLGDRVVGITKFCIHPDEWFRNKNRVGGTKNVDVEKVKALQPDLIIGNKEENEKENILALEKIAPVWMSDIFNLQDSLQMISSLGQMLGCLSQAQKMILNIEVNFRKLENLKINKKVAYFIWKNPYIAVGPNTFIHHILADHLSLQNVVEKERYPEFEFDTFEKSIDLILLSSEPYPFKEKHIDEIQNLLPQAEVLLVDGEYFSWYGSRLLEAPDYFLELFGEGK